MAALRVLWRGLTQFERYGWLYVWLNILSIVLSIPVITAPAAYAGLCHFSYTAQTTLTASLSDYWDGFRANLGRGLIVGAANVVIFGMLSSNFSYYANQTSLPFIVLRLVWLTIIFFTVSVQFYLWPILDEMDRPNLREGLRNAVIMTLANPAFTLIVLFASLLIIAISVATVAPLLVITGSLMACISTSAVLDRFGRYEVQTPIAEDNLD